MKKPDSRNLIDLLKKVRKRPRTESEKSDGSDHNIDIFGYKRMWIEIRDHFIIKKKQTENKPLIRLKRLEFQKNGIMYLT